MSHPVWVCGLKHNGCITAGKHIMSHPVWVCGLKPRNFCFMIMFSLSHPVWVCGLKPSNSLPSLTPLSHTLYGCVD